MCSFYSVHTDHLEYILKKKPLLASCGSAGFLWSPLKPFNPRSMRASKSDRSIKLYSKEQHTLYGTSLLSSPRNPPPTKKRKEQHQWWWWSACHAGVLTTTHPAEQGPDMCVGEIPYIKWLRKKAAEWHLNLGLPQSPFFLPCYTSHHQNTEGMRRP